MLTVGVWDTVSFKLCPSELLCLPSASLYAFPLIISSLGWMMTMHFKSLVQEFLKLHKYILVTKSWKGL
jgi:hypothetical protein